MNTTDAALTLRYPGQLFTARVLAIAPLDDQYWVADWEVEHDVETEESTCGRTTIRANGYGGLEFDHNFPRFEVHPWASEIVCDALWLAALRGERFRRERTLSRNCRPTAEFPQSGNREGGDV